MTMTFQSTVWAIQHESKEQSNSNEENKKPKSYIQQTHDYSKAQANSVLNAVLTQVMFEALNLDTSNVSAYQLDKIQQQTVFVERQLKSMKSYLQVDDKSILELGPKHLKKLHEDIRSDLRGLRTAKYDFQDQLINAEEVQNVFIQVAESLSKRFEHLCEVGVAIDPYNTTLPIIEPLMPRYSLSISIPIAGEPNPESYAGAHSQVGDSETAKAVWTTTYALSYVGALNVILGKSVFSTAALTANATMAQSAMALGAAAAVTFVIAAVVVLISLHEATASLSESC